ncbi:Aste57867_10596 [Aphanomyces stellatus]|uniref:Aste57867_10596 protein n=1 Tax=Aphanomyces stellatus TaxID=120398 RepID=A0A485KRU0_9STRA|nr:hypothetical protein As57867_010556 [Aphanomyces stellatus]VFT87468.1 Aste57867_10596 [Aphanomyces stellatus]
MDTTAGETKTLLAKQPSARRATAVPLVRQLSDFAENTNQTTVNKHVSAVLVHVGADPADRITSSFVLVALVLAIFLPFFVSPVFVYLKLDAIVAWSWAQVFIPIWVFDAAWLYLTYFSHGIAPVDAEDHFDDADERIKDVHVTDIHTEDADVVAVDITTETRPENRIFNLFVVAMYILTQLFVALKLDGAINWHWAALMTPYYVTAIMQGNCIALAHVGQVVLVATKLDGTLHWGWNMVFFPYWITVAVAVVLVPMGVFAATKFALANAAADADDDKPPSPALPCCAALTALVAALATSSPFILLMYKLNWDLSFDILYIFFPYFIVAGLVFATLLVFGLVSICASDVEDNVV